MSTHNEFKGRGFREAKWPGLIIATQDTELPKEVIETIKTNCKTSYEELIKNRGGEVVKLGEGGATFDPYVEFSKLPDDMKGKLTEEAIKIIEKRDFLRS